MLSQAWSDCLRQLRPLLDSGMTLPDAVHHTLLTCLKPLSTTAKQYADVVVIGGAEDRKRCRLGNEPLATPTTEPLRDAPGSAQQVALALWGLKLEEKEASKKRKIQREKKAAVPPNGTPGLNMLKNKTPQRTRTDAVVRERKPSTIRNLTMKFLRSDKAKQVFGALLKKLLYRDLARVSADHVFSALALACS